MRREIYICGQIVSHESIEARNIVFFNAIKIKNWDQDINIFGIAVNSSQITVHGLNSYKRVYFYT